MVLVLPDAKHVWVPNMGSFVQTLETKDIHLPGMRSTRGLDSHERVLQGLTRLPSVIPSPRFRVKGAASEAFMTYFR